LLCPLRFRHDWRGQCFSAYANANSNAHGHSHSYSHTYGNPNSNTDSNSFRNAVDHTTAAYTNGDPHRFTNTRWKASPDTAVAPNTTSAPHAVTGRPITIRSNQ
jgi:hypothetical protein